MTPPRRQEHCCKTRMQNNIALDDGELIFFFFCGSPIDLAVYMKLKNDLGREKGERPSRQVPTARGSQLFSGAGENRQTGLAG